MALGWAGGAGRAPLPHYSRGPEEREGRWGHGANSLLCESESAQVKPDFISLEAKSHCLGSSGLSKATESFHSLNFERPIIGSVPAPSEGPSRRRGPELSLDSGHTACLQSLDLHLRAAVSTDQQRARALPCLIFFAPLARDQSSRRSGSSASIAPTSRG